MKRMPTLVALSNIYYIYICYVFVITTFCIQSFYSFTLVPHFSIFRLALAWFCELMPPCTGISWFIYINIHIWYSCLHGKFVLPLMQLFSRSKYCVSTLNRYSFLHPLWSVTDRCGTGCRDEYYDKKCTSFQVSDTGKGPAGRMATT